LDRIDISQRKFWSKSEHKALIRYVLEHSKSGSHEAKLIQALEKLLSQDLAQAKDSRLVVQTARTAEQTVYQGLVARQTNLVYISFVFNQLSIRVASHDTNCNSSSASTISG